MRTTGRALSAGARLRTWRVHVASIILPAMVRAFPSAKIERGLTAAEKSIARSIFGNAIDLDAVRLRWRKWWPFQPRNVTMAPRGHIHFHPANPIRYACLSDESEATQGHLIHELVHVWQHQRGVNLLLRRHPFCRYDYRFEPGKPFQRYGIEQQAEIVRHVFLMRRGQVVAGKPSLQELEAILPFRA